MMKVVASVVLFGVTLACLAAQRAESNPQNLPMLSEVVPEPFADFIRRHGVDRPVDLPVGELDQIDCERELANADAVAVVETLRPRAYFGLFGPVTLVEAVVPPESERDDKAPPRTLIIAGTMVRLSNDTDVPTTAEITLGSVIARGLLLNSGDTTITVRSPLGVTAFEPGEALYVGARPSGGFEEDPAGPSAVKKCPSCTVTCGAGYYACCNKDFWTCPTCNCVSNGTDADCDTGGEGATGCGLSGMPVDPVE